MCTKEGLLVIQFKRSIKCKSDYSNRLIQQLAVFTPVQRRDKYNNAVELN